MRVLVAGCVQRMAIIDAHIDERSSNSFQYGWQPRFRPPVFRCLRDFGGSVAQPRALEKVSALECISDPFCAYRGNQGKPPYSEAASEAWVVTGAISKSWRTALIADTSWGIHGESYLALRSAYPVDSLDRGALLCA